MVRCALALAVIAVLALLGAAREVVPAAALASAPYAEWAHSHWVWLSAKEATQASIEELAADYMARGVPVGAVDFDSSWETGFNDFVVSPQRIQNLTAMVDSLHAKGVRVILWITSMVDKDSPNFAVAESSGYFIKDVLGKPLLMKWWHGTGGLIDYTNPAAVDWWHTQMNAVLDTGIDGWKCDGTDPYILEGVVPIGHKGVVTRKEYSDAYYRDFFYYSRQRLGEDRLIMSRPVDSFGPIYFSFSPRDVVFSGWVGDLDPTWDGLKEGINRMRISAERKYVNFGTDIAGYRSGDRTVAMFTRWFQLGAFCPLMENGGNNEHRPWMYDTPGSTTVLDTYRNFVNIHMSLLPYFMTTGTEAWENDRSAMAFTTKTDFLLGADIFVAPMMDNTTSRSVEFPESKTGDWVNWWNSSTHYKPRSTVDYECPMDE